MLLIIGNVNINFIYTFNIILFFESFCVLNDEIDFCGQIYLTKAYFPETFRNQHMRAKAIMREKFWYTWKFKSLGWIWVCEGFSYSENTRMEALFACARCHSRHPFEELSSGDQLCKVSVNKVWKTWKQKCQTISTCLLLCALRINHLEILHLQSKICYKE